MLFHPASVMPLCAGDFERGLQLPVNKLCDRYASSIVQVQLGMYCLLSSCKTVEYYIYHRLHSLSVRHCFIYV